MEARLAPIDGTELSLAANPLAIGQDARLERVLAHADADAAQMTMRLLLGTGGNVRLEDSHEGIVEHELVVFRDHLEHILIVVLERGSAHPERDEQHRRERSG